MECLKDNAPFHLSCAWPWKFENGNLRMGNTLITPRTWNEMKTFLTEDLRELQYLTQYWDSYPFSINVINERGTWRICLPSFIPVHRSRITLKINIHCSLRPRKSDERWNSKLPISSRHRDARGAPEKQFCWERKRGEDQRRHDYFLVIFFSICCTILQREIDPEFCVPGSILGLERLGFPLPD